MALAEWLFNGVSLETPESRQLLPAKSSLQMLGVSRKAQVPGNRLKNKPVTDSGVLPLCLTIFRQKILPPLTMEGPETSGHTGDVLLHVTIDIIYSFYVK